VQQAAVQQAAVQQAAVQQAAVQQAAVQQAAVQQAAVQQVVVGGGVHAGAGVLPENIRGALQPLLEKGYQVRTVNRQ
jgi:hypothetical protein